MKSQRVTLVLSVMNLILLAVLLAERAAVSAQAVPEVVRARSWELVDEHGRSRASMTVAPGGEAVFRLRDATGTIRVKLSAGADGSGLVLLDARTELGVKLQADADGSRLELTNPDGRQQITRP